MPVAHFWGDTKFFTLPPVFDEGTIADAFAFVLLEALLRRDERNFSLIALIIRDAGFSREQFTETLLRCKSVHPAVGDLFAGFVAAFGESTELAATGTDWSDLLPKSKRLAQVTGAMESFERFGWKVTPFKPDYAKKLRRAGR